MRDIIKEIPLILFIGIFSIPMVLSDFARGAIIKYIDWAWADSSYIGRGKQ